MSWRVRKRADEAEGQEVELNEQIDSRPVHLHEPLSPEARRLLDLKVKVHRTLIDRINLSLLDKLSPEQIRAEAGDLIAEILVEEDAALNTRERAQMVTEVLDELLGLKYQLSLGFYRRIGRAVLSFAITENLQNFNNTPDVGVQIGFAYSPALGYGPD